MKQLITEPMNEQLLGPLYNYLKQEIQGAVDAKTKNGGGNAIVDKVVKEAFSAYTAYDTSSVPGDSPLRQISDYGTEIERRRAINPSDPTIPQLEALRYEKDQYNNSRYGVANPAPDINAIIMKYYNSGQLTSDQLKQVKDTLTSLGYTG
jgi:hypothetical protein